ncbi:hypothetical protein OKT24_18395 [Aeromonas veronii]|nr:hypothetical protein [Aeromonas veronii]
MNQLVSNVSFWAGVIFSWAAVKAFLSVSAVIWIQVTKGDPKNYELKRFYSLLQVALFLFTAYNIWSAFENRKAEIEWEKPNQSAHYRFGSER